ncbi:trypsin-like serine peptidase [Streptomyces monticola]|uniref:Trypsin-like serine peptidase n=1 Tax=Streptomyces monticola TaxID=2666263 RepID=A0ABW2JAV5_9ACTN
MRSIRPALAAASLAVALVLTATACESGDKKADAKPTNSAAQEGDQAGGEGGAELPEDLDAIADRLKEHGIDVDKWKDGEWKNWDKDKWLREAKDFANPVIEDLWSPERMKSAKDPSQTISAKAASGSEGVTDPEPRPVRAQKERTPYHNYAAPVGKIFFDTPEGTAVCSGTVVKDPRNPGKSNLVWTAGHCVHQGKKGGWYRNIVFTPAYNDKGKSPAQMQNAQPQEVAPYGNFWADWVSTSGEWIDGTTATDPEGGSYEYDYAVMHVKPEKGGKSLEETVGAALPVDFSSPAPKSVDAMGAWGYPQAEPFNGVLMHKCVDRPGRLSLTSSAPTMYRIGCTMTAGSSGGGWFREISNGKLALVSNTSIGPAGSAGWLAGPQLGDGAKRVFDTMSEKYGNK